MRKLIKHPFDFQYLLTPGDSSPKTLKSGKAGKGYLSTIMYLTPEKGSGLGNLCASASAGCTASCLYTAGRGAMGKVKRARLERTKLWFNDRGSFIILLSAELTRFVDSLPRNTLAAVRLNGTSDIMWEKELPELFRFFSNVQFYDYTKHFKRMLGFCNGELPSNYHLTFSRSEKNDAECRKIVKAGGNIACVFRNQLPETHYGVSVFNMDDTDLRFLDPKGVGGLKAKGKAKKDTTGFVID